MVPANSSVALTALKGRAGSRKRKSTEKKEGGKMKDEGEDSEDEENKELEDKEELGFAEVQAFLNSLKNEGAKEKEGRDQEGESDSASSGAEGRSPSARLTGRSFRPRKKRRSDDLTITSTGLLASIMREEDQVVRVSESVICKDGHYELTQNAASVEDFVGLTGAGEVLNHRHRTPTPPPPAED